MRLAALALIAGLVAPVLAQPGSQPPTGAPAATGATAPTGAPAATGAAGATGSTISIEPVKPPPIPVPSGPVVNTQQLEGGIIAEDLKVGDGYEVKPGGAVVALYHGTLKEGGTVFDSAFERGEPIAFALGGVIQGWQKGVPGMKIGGVRRLTIPAALAYGERGAPPKIPANADLVFVIQLVDALQMDDLKPGAGEELGEFFVAVANQVVKDKDGKEVDRSDAAHPHIWIPGEMQPMGWRNDVMQMALAGMKVGGTRRVTVPKEMNVNRPELADKRPPNVPLTFEIEVTAVRNIAPRKQ